MAKLVLLLLLSLVIVITCTDLSELTSSLFFYESFDSSVGIISLSLSLNYHYHYY
jgi:hypothetical protein